MLKDVILWFVEYKVVEFFVGCDEVFLFLK